MTTFIEPAIWGQRQDLRRAYNALAAQGYAIVRRFVGVPYSEEDEGFKERLARAQEIWGELEKHAAPPYGGRGPKRREPEPQDRDLTVIVTPFLDAMRALNITATGLEKTLGGLAEELDVWSWVEGVKGIGALTLAGIVCEAGGTLDSYAAVRPLWKRFGLAVIDGERQRKVAGDPELAIRHGYSPTRRALAYNVGVSLMRKADPVYRAIYDERKALEGAKEGMKPVLANKRAQRYMVKCFYRDLWLRWHGIEVVAPEFAMAA